MAKEIDRAGPRELTPYARESREEGQQLTVSPITALFLKTRMGTERLTKLVDARTNLVESVTRFGAASERLERLPVTVAQEMAVEEEERARRHATLSHEIAQKNMETDLIDSEKRRREQENQTEIARLEAEELEHKQKAQRLATPKERTRAHKDGAGAPLDEAFNAAKRHLHVARELKKMHREVDEAVAAGEFTEEEGERIKEEMEDLIRKKIHKE